MTQTQTQTRTCSECRYWQSESQQTGQCRRHAPMSVVFKVDEKTSFESRFPETRASDWCGDFAAK